MKYSITVSFSPDDLMSAYCENIGITIEECDVSIEELLETELGWLNASGIHVEEVKEVSE